MSIGVGNPETECHVDRTVVVLDRVTSRRAAERFRLGAGEAVDLEHADLEVAGGAERRVVEGGAAVRLAEADVLVHPDRLPVASSDGDHGAIPGHE